MRAKISRKLDLRDASRAAGLTPIPTATPIALVRGRPSGSLDSYDRALFLEIRRAALHGRLAGIDRYQPAKLAIVRALLKLQKNEKLRLWIDANSIQLSAFPDGSIAHHVSWKMAAEICLDTSRLDMIPGFENSAVKL